MSVFPCVAFASCSFALALLSVYRRRAAVGECPDAEKATTVSLVLEDARHWRYKGEGGLNVTFSYVGPRPSLRGSLLRVRKESAGEAVSAAASTPFSQSRTLLPRDALEYAHGPMRRALGGRFVAQSIALPLPALLSGAGASFLSGLNARLVGDFGTERPLSRRSRGLELGACVATLCLDCTSSEALAHGGDWGAPFSPAAPWGLPAAADNGGGGPCICIELKPKCLVPPTVPRGGPPPRACRFCIQQVTKALSSSSPLGGGGPPLLSHYCPMDLLGVGGGEHADRDDAPPAPASSALSSPAAGLCRARQLRALLSLTLHPQNNFRIFCDGALVFHAESLDGGEETGPGDGGEKAPSAGGHLIGGSGAIATAASAPSLPYVPPMWHHLDSRILAEASRAPLPSDAASSPSSSSSAAAVDLLPTGVCQSKQQPSSLFSFLLPLSDSDEALFRAAFENECAGSGSGSSDRGAGREDISASITKTTPSFSEHPLCFPHESSPFSSSPAMDASIAVLSSILRVSRGCPPSRRIFALCALISDLLSADGVLGALAAAQRLDVIGPAKANEILNAAAHQFAESREGGHFLSKGGPSARDAAEAAENVLAAHLECGVACAAPNTHNETADGEDAEQKQPARMLGPDRTCWKRDAHLVRDFLLAATAKDASIMLTFRPHEGDGGGMLVGRKRGETGEEHANGKKHVRDSADAPPTGPLWLGRPPCRLLRRSSGPHVVYTSAIIDLDPKPFGRIPKYAVQHEALSRNFESELGRGALEQSRKVCSLSQA